MQLTLADEAFCYLVRMARYDWHDVPDECEVKASCKAAISLLEDANIDYKVGIPYETKFANGVIDYEGDQIVFDNKPLLIVGREENNEKYFEVYYYPLVIVVYEYDIEEAIDTFCNCMFFQIESYLEEKDENLTQNAIEFKNKMKEFIRSYVIHST